MDNKQHTVDALLNLGSEIIADVEGKTRAQLLDLIEMTAPVDRLAPAKRSIDTILRDLVRRIIEKNTSAIDTEVHLVISPSDVSNELFDKWGYDFKDEEVAAFENLYNKLKNDYQLSTAIHIEFLKLACISRVKYTRAMVENEIKTAQDYTHMFNDAIAKLQPKV